jgi:hypothetical protein
MKTNKIFALLFLASSYVFGQDAPILSQNNTWPAINIKANTSSIPVIRFTRWTGSGSDQHNAYVGQFYNSANGQYSFGIGTGISATGDQNFNNTVLTALLSGDVGIGTTLPSQKFEVNGNILLNAENSAFGMDALANARLGIIKKMYHWPAIASDINSPIIFAQTNEAGIFTNISTATLTERMRIDANGNVGIGNAAPQGKLDIGVIGGLSAVLGRLSEGNSTGSGTFLGISTYYTQPTNAKSFAIEHSFYGQVNSSINFNRGWGVTGGFICFNTNDNTEKMRITESGNVGIGTASPDAKLAVNGTVHAKEVKVDLNITGPDYVFEKDYNLMSLEEIKTYIEKHKHLPEVPSAKEMETNGVNLSEMNMILLKKVEELTLHVIELRKELNDLKNDKK